jgi:hypothetical protein
MVSGFAATWMQPTFSPAVLLGVGKRERVTLGAKTYFVLTDPNSPMFLDGFATVHLSPRWSVFVGAEVVSFIDTFQDGDGYPLFTVGVGYKFPPFTARMKL